MQIDQITSVEMAPEPVTLRVQIYNSTYNVAYPSQQRVVDLISEFATMCKGEWKPCGKRKFFVCIHCGENGFSNKMMLNRHRFIDGCPKALYPDGSRALLLPYPDFKPGEGKKVEVISRRTWASTAVDITRGADADDMGEEPAEDGSLADGGMDLLDEGGAAHGLGKSVNIIAPLQDLFVGHAPEKPPEGAKNTTPTKRKKAGSRSVGGSLKAPAKKRKSSPRGILKTLNDRQTRVTRRHGMEFGKHTIAKILVGCGSSGVKGDNGGNVHRDVSKHIGSVENMSEVNAGADSGGG